jgi:hypothetical protein
LYRVIITLNQKDHTNVMTNSLTICLVKSILSQKIDIVLLNKFQNPKQDFFQDSIHFSGAIYGGGIEPFKKFIQLFYDKFDKYIDNNQFIGCDQQIISSVYLDNTELFNTINSGSDNYTETNKLIKQTKNIDKWFYVICYYSL